MRSTVRGFPQSWVGFGILSMVLGIALVLGTEGGRWLGAIGFVGGLVLVMMGPQEARRQPGAATRGGSTGHSCCVPPELTGVTGVRPARRRPGSH